MYGIAIEYGLAADSPSPDPLLRAACRDVLVRQPGYRRRLALMADSWRRIVDLYLFADADAARAVLDRDEWRALAADHHACRAAAPALLTYESPWGDLVVLLRSKIGPNGGGQSCWRDHLARADPEATLW